MDNHYTEQDAFEGLLSSVFLDADGLDSLIDTLVDFRSKFRSVRRGGSCEPETLRCSIDFRIDPAPAIHPIHDEPCHAVMIILGCGILINPSWGDE